MTFNRLAASIAVAALSICGAFALEPIQNASAQVGFPGGEVFENTPTQQPGPTSFPSNNPNNGATVFIDGVGTSSISSFQILSNWFGRDNTVLSGNFAGSAINPLFSYDANGDGVTNFNEDLNNNGVFEPGEDINNNGVLDVGTETFNFWDGQGEPIDPPFTRFASYTIAGSSNARSAISEPNRGFLFDFYASDGEAVDFINADLGAPGFDVEAIVNVIPVDINPGLPLFVGFYQVQGSISEQDAAGNLCLYLTRGLDFNANGVIDGAFESGRIAAQSLGFGEPSFNGVPGLGRAFDPNCGTLFPGFPGFDANPNDGLPLGFDPNDLLSGQDFPFFVNE
jgi:hypothetical protein